MHPSRPVAQGDEPVEASASDEVPPDVGTDDTGWPVLSELDLEVCLTDTAVPGAAPPSRGPEEP
jgi:hypothetical protein